MKKLKINPLTLSNSNNVKLASKNILDVINFQNSMSEELNRVLLEFNSILPLITEPFDSSEILESIKRIQRSSKELALKVDSTTKGDDLKKQIENIKNSIPEAFDPSDLKKEISLLKLENENLKKSLSEMKEIKKSVSLVQSEIRSARKVLRLEQDQLRSLVQNKIEVK